MTCIETKSFILQVIFENKSFMSLSTVPSQFDCNFEANNLCLWHQDGTDQFNWTVRQPANIFLSIYDTLQDHTTGTGMYIFLNVYHTDPLETVFYCVLISG